ncbi:hypothetical protein CYMTET_36271, partial [Cymbomonas tetramitiformis]
MVYRGAASVANFVITNSRVKRALVVADSNIAVDNLAQGLIAAGLRVVRIGNPATVRPSLREYTLQAQAAKHPAGIAAAKLRGDVSAVSTRGATSSGGKAQEREVKQMKGDMWKRSEELQKVAEDAVISGSQAVVAT